MLAYKTSRIGINQDEFEKFLGVVILFKVYKSSGENVFKFWSQEDWRPIFWKLMGGNRYQQILRVFNLIMRIQKGKNRSADKPTSMRAIFEERDFILHDGHTPGPYVTVDKHLVCFGRRC